MQEVVVVMITDASLSELFSCVSHLGKQLLYL